MGLFDRLTDKKPAPRPATPPPPAPVSVPEAEKPAAAGGVMPRLATAREKLKARDLEGAMAIYEEVMAVAADRSDVLVTISADLGTNGHVQQMIELLAPRYDVAKHGAAAGVNLLQAYLATRNAEAAQHLLDLLFSLQRPELESRLVGFSKAVAELFVSETETATTESAMQDNKISLVSISKPIWFYGLESVGERLLPRKEGRLRRVAFAQCSMLNSEEAAALAAQPEHPLCRFSRGLPLWLAETFHFSAGYDPVAALGTLGTKRYAFFPVEWVPENIRQLNESMEGGFEYIVTTALRFRHADYELALRIWEVKKFRQVKLLSWRWSPSTMDEVLAQMQQQVRTYMEWSALPAGEGLAYAAPAAPQHYIQSLAGALTLFLGEKQVLSPDQPPPDTSLMLQGANANPADARAQLALVAAVIRLKAQQAPVEAESLAHAEAWLASEAAQAAGLSGLALQLK